MVTPNEGILNPGNFGCGVRGILGFEIRTTAQGIRNPTNDWNPESKFHRHKIGGQFLESGILSVEFKIQDCLVLPYMGREWPGNNKRLGAMTRSEQSGI